MSLHDIRAAQSALVTWQVAVTATPASIAPQWVAATAYVLGRAVVNGGKLYRCITAGTSAGSGGPTGTSTDITDGTVHWRCLKVNSSFKGGAILTNLSTSTSPLFYGDSSLAATNGEELAANKDHVLQAPDLSAVYVCTASGTATASVVAYP
jgi:hypothetical protein